MTEIKMPQFGLTMDFGTITEWLKEEGDPVKVGESLARIETDKMENNVEATGEGILLKIVTPAGSEVPVQGLMGYIGAPGEAIPADATPVVEAPAQTASAAQSAGSVSAAAPSAADGGKMKATPVAKKLAAELGIDLTKVVGTGPMGRISREDVEKAAAGAPAAAAPVASTVPAVPAEAEYTLVPYTGMRKRIGENMSKSWALAPRVTNMVSADVTELMALRATINSGKEKAERVSVTDLLICLTARSLKKFPAVNASLTSEGIRRYSTVNMGMAVAVPDGLLVPVIRGADRKSLPEISRECKLLAGKAHSGGLSGDDMHGGTFTVSSLGGYGSVDFFTPIINQPESAILGVGRSVDTPVVRDGQVVVRTMMGLSLSYDHRVIDGAVAAEFIADLLSKLERPLQSILED